MVISLLRPPTLFEPKIREIKLESRCKLISRNIFEMNDFFVFTLLWNLSPNRNILQIQEATKLLNEYNERLEQELKDRKKVGKMILDFLASQNSLLAAAEERLELYRDKLDKVNAIRDDLKSHIQSLPDLTKLPDVTGGLAPLPSAGDLFMK